MVEFTFLTTQWWNDKGTKYFSSAVPLYKTDCGKNCIKQTVGNKDDEFSIVFLSLRGTLMSDQKHRGLSHISTENLGII